MTPKTQAELAAMLKQRGWLLCQSVAVEAEPKDWIALVPTGKFESHWQHPEGFTVTDEHLQQMVRNFGIYNNEVLCDWEHMSAWGGDSKASGWIKAVEIRDGRLWGQVEWTPTALQQIKDREYRYLSPAFKLKYEDERTGQEMGARLFSIALTNIPYFETNLVPIAAKGGMMDELKKIAAALGLPETATVDEILAAIQTLEDELASMSGDTAAAKTKPLSELTKLAKTKLATLTAASQLVEQLRTELKLSAEAKPEAFLAALKLREGDPTQAAKLSELQTEVATMKAEKLVAQGQAEGKITAATREWAMAFAKSDAAGFTTWLASAPVTVPVNEDPKKKPLTTAAGEAIVTERDEKVAAQFGGDAKAIAAQRVKRESGQG